MKISNNPISRKPGRITINNQLPAGRVIISLPSEIKTKDLQCNKLIIHGSKGLKDLSQLEMSRSTMHSIQDLRILSEQVDIYAVGPDISQTTDGLIFKRKLAPKLQLSNLRGLAEIKNLRSLTVVNAQIDSLEQLSSLKKLKYIRLPHNQIRDIRPVKYLKHLQYLDVSHNPFAIVCRDTQKTLYKHKSLQELYLPNLRDFKSVLYLAEIPLKTIFTI